MWPSCVALLEVNLVKVNVCDFFLGEFSDLLIPVPATPGRSVLQEIEEMMVRVTKGCGPTSGTQDGATLPSKWVCTFVMLCPLVEGQKLTANGRKGEEEIQAEKSNALPQNSQTGYTADLAPDGDWGAHPHTQLKPT